MFRFLLIIGLLCAIVASPSLAASTAAPTLLQTSVYGNGVSCVMPTAEVAKAVSRKRCGKNGNVSAVVTCHFPLMFVGNDAVLFLRDEAAGFETFPQPISFSIIPGGHFRPPRLATV